MSGLKWLNYKKGLFVNGPPEEANGPPENYEMKADGLSGRKPGGLNDGKKVHGQGYISNLLNFISMELFLVE